MYKDLQKKLNAQQKQAANLNNIPMPTGPHGPQNMIIGGPVNPILPVSHGLGTTS